MAESSNGSTPDTTNSTPPPPVNQTAKERVAEALIGFGQAGHAVGLAHVAQVLADSRQRVRDSHRAMAKAAQVDDVIGQSPEEPMQLMVTGDIHTNTSTPPQANGNGSLIWKIVPWAIAAASGAGLLGTGAGLLLSKVGQVVPAIQKIEKIEKTDGFLIELIPSK